MKNYAPTLAMVRYALAVTLLWLGLVCAAVVGADRSYLAERYIRMADDPSLTPQQKAAYCQLSLLHTANLGSSGVRPDVHPGSRVMRIFFDMGIESLPVLVNALDDTTSTRTITSSGRGGDKPHTWAVNELAALIIHEVAERDFPFPTERDAADLWFCLRNYPDEVPQYKKVILDWYEENRHRTPAERKIADITSDSSGIRESAVRWLGKHKQKAGLEAIVNHVNRFLHATDAHGIKNWELTTCAVALGQLGDAKGREPVRRICKYLSSQEYTYRSSTLQLDYLFQAYHALAILGEKEEVLRELGALHEAHLSDQGMSAEMKKKFTELLEEAKKW